MASAPRLDGAAAFRFAQRSRARLCCPGRREYRVGMFSFCVSRARALGIAALALPLACSPSSNPASGTTATAPAAAGPRVYVSDETGTEVVVIDPVAGTVVQRIAVGKRPRGIKLSPDGARLFVALSGSP